MSPPKAAVTGEPVVLVLVFIIYLDVALISLSRAVAYELKGE